MKLYNLLFITLCLLFISCKNTQKEDNSSEKLTSETIESKINEKFPETIKIIPIEHASTIIEAEGVSIYIDPTGGAKPYTKMNKADMILITDIHGDHMNTDTLDSLDLAKAKVIVPAAVAEKLPAKYTEQLVIINNGETKEIKGVTIEAIPMYNLREEALKFHDKGRGNGYVITIAGERLYFSGDTEDIPEMRALKNIDRAFVCMNLPYTMTVESAADAVLEFKPKSVYPYHYRGTEGLSDVRKFKEIVNTGDKSIEVIQLDWYPKMK
ncbi:MBL fold metallo-hydrolase [Aquimarina sp. MMG016]|uniref:MBL fold metallo-hydrolase n=1 Tax=Aquimarina sp. MMG016 TaxID=2822690 RepID=UPI001B3A45E2|nr:MBL fold metallo-hydrolase [Aquimarina sp. MMG016]MBQ4819391.1 MBL fold metallo-hydrolase [Aquimarina sp. MMG016]